MFRWGIEKTFTLDCDDRRALRERIKATVRAHLVQRPDSTLPQLITHIQQKQGVTVTAPWVCALRQELGLAPDNQQSRAAKARGVRK